MIPEGLMQLTWWEVFYGTLVAWTIGKTGLLGLAWLVTWRQPHGKEMFTTIVGILEILFYAVTVITLFAAMLIESGR